MPVRLGASRVRTEAGIAADVAAVRAGRRWAHRTGFLGVALLTAAALLSPVVAKADTGVAGVADTGFTAAGGTPPSS
ncbi:hypothetical protein ACFV4N_23330 [Actinosynnema sp. NPDC059797]